MSVKKNYYEVLGVSSKATDAEIKRAFRNKAMELHPDRNREDPKATEKFQELNSAYETLKEPKSRKDYDQNLKKNIFEDFFSKYQKKETKQNFQTSGNKNNDISTIFIGKLPNNTTKNDLLNAFSIYNPYDAKVVEGNTSKPSFGFVKFWTKEEAEAVLKEKPCVFIKNEMCKVKPSFSNLT